MPAAVADLARLGLADAARLGELRLGGSLGFVVLHRCGDGFYFLLVATWENGNELWETVWAKDGDGDPEFHPWPVEGSHRPTFCVWELGVVAHERAAWTRYLRSAQDRDARPRLPPRHLRGRRVRPRGRVASAALGGARLTSTAATPRR